MIFALGRAFRRSGLLVHRHFFNRIFAFAASSGIERWQEFVFGKHFAYRSLALNDDALVDASKLSTISCDR